MTASAGTQAARPGLKGWRDALLAAAAGFAAMTAVAAAGLAAAGAGSLPDGAFPRVLAAVVVMAAGGSVEVTGGAGFLGGADAAISVLPLSVTLAGALTAALLFLRPLRLRAVAGTGELLVRAGQLAVLWLALLTGYALVARQTFGISTGDNPLGDIAEVLDAAPTVGFRADIAATLGFGLLWIAGLIVLALLVSRRAPLPARLVRFHAAVRPAASATVLMLLSYVVLGIGIGIVVALTRGHAAETFAVVLLGLPNLVWVALTLGLGGAWEGRVDGPFGLPMPQILDDVLRTPDVSRLDVASLAEYDGRAWWLVAVAAVLLLVTGVVAAMRSPAWMKPWQHAVHLGVALGVAVLAVCLLGDVQARIALSLLGIGEVDGLGGRVELSPLLWRTVGLAVLWGAVAGLLGGLTATRLRRRD
ncbi:streptophobe family protein [Streptomyces bambusae]|uniref:streptophobe family protein n=1 Tax=Streptomyces bambusae TaxID=1550616 RepID=UPI001CFDE2EA|nr:streptophobe family protein [Streptomyces bambusae]MCB5166735.1 streptophobe family protein [Streptomyces bambusae]